MSVLYVGACPECGARLEGRLDCPGLIPPPVIKLGCQNQKPTIVVECAFVDSGR